MKRSKGAAYAARQNSGVALYKEIVLRFKDKLVNGIPAPPAPTVGAAQPEPRAVAGSRIVTFRRSIMTNENNAISVVELGGSSHYFHWGDIESIEATPARESDKGGE